MEKLIVFVVSFIVVYLLYLFTVVLRKLKMERYKSSNQVVFFVKKYGLDFNKIKINKFAHILALSNSFVIALAMLISEFIDNFILKLLVALLVLIPTMLIIYSLIGKYIKRKCK